MFTLIFYTGFVPLNEDAMLGKVDLAAAILELATEASSLDSLRERLNVSAGDLDDNLQLLSSKSLVTLDGEGGIAITKKGEQFLALYKSISARYLSVPA